MNQKLLNINNSGNVTVKDGLGNTVQITNNGVFIGDKASGRREVWQIEGGAVPPANGIVGSSLNTASALIFDPTTNNDIVLQIPIPDNVDLTNDINIVLKYVMSTNNAGDVKLDLDYVVADLAEDIDPASFDDTITSTFTPGGGADLLRTVQFTIPFADVDSQNSILFCKLTRDASDGLDTHTGNFNLISIELLYTVEIGGGGGGGGADSDTLTKNRTATAVDYTTIVNDCIIAVTSTAAPRTITLGTPSNVEGRFMFIKDESGGAGTNNITVDCAGGALIDGQASLDITADYGVLKVYSDGTNWFTI